MKLHLKLLFVLLLFDSCERSSCTSSNEIFNIFDASAKEYKLELRNELAISSSLRWWVNNYAGRDGNRYLVVKVQGEDLCTVAELQLIENVAGIENLLDKKGVSYEGAELVGLKYTSIEKDGLVELVFDGVEKIID
jgi:hypothetical protein